MARPVVVNFIGDARKLTSTIDHVEGKAGNLKKAFGALAGLGIGTALVSGLTSTINAAKESAAITRETETRIRAMGNAANISADDVGKLAEAISNKTGIDDEQIQAGANMLLTFKNVRNEVGKGNDIFNRATLVATDMAAKFGGDASTSAIRLGKALDNPIAGVTALTRIGVTFDEGQKKQIKTMVEAGNILGAQKIILGEVAKQTSGAAAASTTSWDKFLVKVGNIQEDLGKKLLPVIDKMADRFIRAIKFVEDNSTAFKALGVVLAAIVATMGIVAATTRVVSTVQAVARGATVAWTAAQWLLNAALRANPIGLVITAIALLAAGIVIAYKRSETFRNIVDGVWRGVKASVIAAVDFIIRAVRNWLNIQIDVVAGILHVMGKLPGPMGAPFRKAEEAVRGAKATINDQIDRIQAKVNSLRGKDIKITAEAAVRINESVRGYLKAASVPGFHRAGARIPGWGGGDIYPAMLEPGEAVVPKEAVRDPGFQAWARARGIPGFQAGGLIGGDFGGNLDRVHGKIVTATEVIGRRFTERLADMIGAGLSKAIERGIGATGALGGAGGPGGWQWQMNVLRARFPGLALISGFRPGAITSTGNRSYHSMGRAVDIPPRWDVFNWIAATYGAKTRELIFTPAGARQIKNGQHHVFTGGTIQRDHYNHVHWAYGRGGRIPEDVFGVGRDSGDTYQFHGGETVLRKGATQTVNVYAATNADPFTIGREVAWAMKTGGI